MSAELVHREPCGCTFDDVTGIPIWNCPAHGRAAQAGTPATAHDRLFEAALPAADRLKAIHTMTHVGTLETCRLPGCSEARELLAAIRDCWPKEQKQSDEGEKP